MSAAPPWFGYPPQVATTSDDIPNDSGVPGASVSDALDQLAADITALQASLAANVTALQARLLSERWNAPSVADIDDTEFTQDLTALQAAGWALYDGAGSVVAVADDTIDPYVDDTAAQHVNGNTYRSSWLTTKVRRNTTRYYFLKPFTPTTNQFFWSRVGFRQVSVNDGCDIGLVICAATAGHPDLDNRVEIIWVDFAGSKIANYNRVTGGGLTPIDSTGSYGDSDVIPPYLGFQKLNTTWHGWLGHDSGSHEWMGSTVQASTMAYIGFVMINASNSPGNGLAQADFVRVVRNTSTFMF